MEVINLYEKTYQFVVDGPVNYGQVLDKIALFFSNKEHKQLTISFTDKEQLVPLLIEIKQASSYIYKDENGKKNVCDISFYLLWETFLTVLPTLERSNKALFSVYDDEIYEGVAHLTIIKGRGFYA